MRRAWIFTIFGLGNDANKGTLAEEKKICFELKITISE
jgi:hypothetical protein